MGRDRSSVGLRLETNTYTNKKHIEGGRRASCLRKLEIALKQHGFPQNIDSAAALTDMLHALSIALSASKLLGYVVIKNNLKNDNNKMTERAQAYFTVG